MYKSKLQELCHRRLWQLPEYQTAKRGPDHNPRYVTTIIVNDVYFETPAPCRTAKQSQNVVAKLALDHFNRPNSSSSPPPNPPPSLSKPYSSSSSSSSSSPPQSSSSAPISSPLLPQSPAQPETQTPPQPPFLQPSFPGTLFTLPQPLAPIFAGSSAPGTAVDDVVVTTSEMQPNLQDAFQETHINRPITSVEDKVTAENQKDMQRLYKNQLQNFAQKRNLNLPLYSSEREGPPHASRFKCKVTIDGQIYESPGFFPTLKDAEHAAARVALMSLSLDGAQEDDIGLYKNLLQEFVQKEKFHLPVYSTSKSGEAHIPIFVSNVDIEGEIFTGQEAKTKKQAEMSAAKVAYTILKERKGKSNQSSLTLLSAHQGQAPVLSSPSSKSNAPSDLQNRANLKPPKSYSPGLVTHNQSEKDKDCAEVKNPHAAIPFPEPSTATGSRDSSSSDITTGCVDAASLSNVQPAPSLPDSNNLVTNSSGTVSTSKVKRVTVYSRKTTVEIAQGGTLLPISDENWVAYSYPEGDLLSCIECPVVTL